MAIRLAAALLVVSAAVDAAAPAAHPAGAHAAACGSGSWIGGSTDICHGVLVYRDYVYDDYGADTGLVGASTTCPTKGGGVTPTGDQRYPAGEEDTADLRELRLTVTGTRLVVTFTLNALFDQASTVAALAIDTDNDPATGGGAWPGLDVSSSGWDTFASFRAGMPGVTVDPAANTITASIPRPAGTTWRVQAATAQADGTVMNVAFRGLDEQGGWFENEQAAALATGDVSRFGQTVDVKDLQDGTTQVEPVGPGVHERVYESAYTLGRGEGMTYEGISDDPRPLGATFNYVGPYQPYGIYIPDKPGPHGLQAILPGLCVGIDARMASKSIETQFGEARNRILIAPLGRGPNGWYTGPGERDVLDAVADAEQSYDVDPSQVLVSGESEGGYGAFRTAELNPDRFAGAITWVGYTDCLNETPLAGSCPLYGADMDPVDFVSNLRWVPTGMLYSGADELVHVETAVAMQQAFAATGGPYIWWMHPAAEHDTYAVLDDYRKEALWSASLARPADPPEVTYRYDPATDDPAFGLVHDHAYWLSAIATAAAGAGSVDLTTQGCGGALPVTSPTTGEGTDPVPWTSIGAAVTGATPLVQAPRLSGTLGNVAALTVDAAATCLAGAPIQYDLTTDGPATVRFTDGRTLVLPGSGEHVGTLP
ncbi:MAG TPA: prolyl oligopeptidase family serine peptidase [Gaiellaceae bacterium]|nr:prolyl oligopeptidase family serine peptidase [Gaiellaceae bacterium]